MDGQKKIANLADLARTREALRAAGKTVVLTNGCFDILHVGHVRYLAQARAHGDCLILGLNSDESVRAIKGPTRPLVSEDERAEVLAALLSVDYVVVFSEPTAERLVELLQPDVYVKGGDYSLDAESGKELPEAKIVASYGGRVVIVPYLPGRSTTEIVNIILNRFGPR